MFRGHVQYHITTFPGLATIRPECSVAWYEQNTDITDFTVQAVPDRLVFVGMMLRVSSV